MRDFFLFQDWAIFSLIALAGAFLGFAGLPDSVALIGRVIFGVALTLAALSFCTKSRS